MTDVTIYSPIGEGGQFSGFDQQLLDFAAKRMSAEQMYEELGSPPTMTPARCLQRVRELLRAQDYLTVHEQKSLLLLDLVKLRDALFEKIDDGTEIRITKQGEQVDVGISVGWFNAASRILRDWHKLIESMKEDVEAGDAMFRKGQADVVVAAIAVMFDRYNGKLEQHGVDLPEAKVLAEIFEEVMPIGFRVIAEKEAA